MSPSKDLSPFERLVLDGLKQNHEATNSLQEKVENVKDELKESIDSLFKQEVVPMKMAITGLKVKSGLWGATAGMIPVIVVLAVLFLKNKHPEAKMLPDNPIEATVTK